MAIWTSGHSAFWSSGFLAFRTSGLSEFGLPGFWSSRILVFWLLNIQTSDHLDFWPSGLLAFWSSGLLDSWTSGLPDIWPSGLLDIQTSGLLSLSMSQKCHFRHTCVYATPISNSWCPPCCSLPILYRHWCCESQLSSEHHTVAAEVAVELLHACPKNFQHVDLFPPLISSVCPSGIRPIHLLHYFWSSLRRRRSRSHRCSRQRVFSGCQISCQFVGFPVNQFKEKRALLSLEKAINSHPSSSSCFFFLRTSLWNLVLFIKSG